MKPRMVSNEIGPFFLPHKYMHIYISLIKAFTRVSYENEEFFIFYQIYIYVYIFLCILISIFNRVFFAFLVV